MANLFVQLKSFDLESTVKSRYEEVDSLPFMKSAYQIPIIVVAYILLVLKIGPELMKNRKAFTLRTVLIIYNAFQVLLSLYMLVKGTQLMLKFSILSGTCNCDDAVARNEILSSMWVYVAAKVTELLDTVFFVMRKKNNQVSFLHVYHHSVVLMVSWSYLKWSPSETGIIIGYLNAGVHVVMYSYYLLSALGPHMAPYLTWKKYITKMQLVQFIACAMAFINNINNSDCPPPKALSIFIIANLIFFLYLFSDFYHKSYVKNKESKKTI